MAPKGWMNNPCAPCYDEVTGLYHLFYQWNPNHHEWGNISWGHAVSKDLITWEHVSHGTINYTLPYVRGSETLSVAVSTDRGMTWIKSKKNPILPGPPSDIEPTAWRDPFVDSWTHIDSLFGRDPGSYVYSVIAGGIHDKTPTCFLYSYNRNDPAVWEYLGPLANIGHHYHPSRWSGDFGVSWEVCNFFSLQDTQFMVVNAEGCDLSKRYLEASLPARPAHHAQGEPKTAPLFSGILDHGCYYAAITLFDPVGRRRILWGWIPEDDITSHQCALQGSAGCLGLPRELFDLSKPHVVRPMHSNVKELSNCSTVNDKEGTFTVTTLAIRPLNDLTKLRQDSSFRIISDICFASTSPVRQELGIKSCSWDISVDVQISELLEEVGLSVCHNKDYTQETVIRFLPLHEVLTEDRSKSTSLTDINTSPDSGPHTLFYTRDPNTRDENT
ncbi:putative beta-Fructufuranosidase [Umbelopsis sp. PMI_123]|nr:putative beta-Fructufuranosidase [Umbelopsis sp. PMI_123]